MIGTFSVVSGRTISAQMRPYLVGTLRVSSTFAARAGAATMPASTRVRASTRGRRMPPQTRAAPVSGELGDDREVLRAQRVVRLEDVVDVVAVDLQGDRALVARADGHLGELLEPGDAPVADHVRASREHAPDDRGHVERVGAPEYRGAECAVVELGALGHVDREVLEVGERVAVLDDRRDAGDLLAARLELEARGLDDVARR